MELRSSKEPHPVQETPFTSKLPFKIPEILENLLKYLDIPTLLEKRSVCKLWSSEATKILTARHCGPAILDYNAHEYPPTSWGPRKLLYQHHYHLENQTDFKRLSSLMKNSINPEILLSYINFQIDENNFSNLEQVEPECLPFYKKHGSQTKCTIYIKITHTDLGNKFIFSFLKQFPNLKSLTLYFKPGSSFSKLKSTLSTSQSSLDFKSLRSFEFISHKNIEDKLLNLFTKILISTPQLKVLNVQSWDIEDLFKPILQDPESFKSLKNLKDLTIHEVKSWVTESKDEKSSRNQKLVKILEFFSESIQALKFIPGGSNIFPVSLFPRMKNLKVLYTFEDFTHPFYQNASKFSLTFPKLNTFLIHQQPDFNTTEYNWPISKKTSSLYQLIWEDNVKHAASPNNQNDHLNVVFLNPYGFKTADFDFLMDRRLSKLNIKSLFFNTSLYSETQVEHEFIRSIFHKSLQKIHSLNHLAMFFTAAWDYSPIWIEEEYLGWSMNWIDRRVLLASRELKLVFL